MIYGAINKDSNNLSKDLEKLFESIGNKQKDYNWLITDCECHTHNPEVEKMFGSKYCWLTGEELTELIKETNFQWIWAVISGFDKNIELKDVLKYELPYADGYTGFWKKPFTLQHPLSHIEIVPWDGYLILLFSDNKKIVADYIEHAENVIKLEHYIDRN